MTASQATYAALLALDEASSSRHVPAQTHAGIGLNPDKPQNPHANSKSSPHTEGANRAMYPLADTRGSGPRGPHRGDLLYWAACLGGACLLLLLGTT